MNLRDAFYERFVTPQDEYESHQRLCQNERFFQMGFGQTLRDQPILDLDDGTIIEKMLYIKYFF